MIVTKLAMFAAQDVTAASEDPKVPTEKAKLPDDRRLALLESQLYGHVLDCIDFGRLNGLQQLMWGILDRLGLPDEDADGDVARKLIRRALVRAAHDPATTFTDVPYGISKEEARAASFDVACPFCRYEDDHPPGDEEEEHEDDCGCCAEMAREWRAKHAKALARRGLGARPARSGN